MSLPPAGEWAYNITDPIEHSPAVAFLAALPRWGRRVPFALTTPYIISTALSSIVTVISGIVVVLLLSVALFIRLGPRRDAVDVILNRIALKPRDYVWHIAVSVVLTFGVALFISLGFIGASVLVSSLHDTLDTIEALLVTVKATGFAVVDLFLLFVHRLKILDPSSEQLRKVLPVLPDVDVDDLVTAFSAMRDYSIERIPDVGPLRAALSELLARIESTLKLVGTYADGVYYAMLILLLCQLFTPLLHFLEEIYIAHNFALVWRIMNYLFYIGVPAFTSWILLAVSSTVGLFVSDACEIMHDYRRHILELPGAALAKNPLIESGLVCLPNSQAMGIKQRLNEALVPLDDPLFGDTARVVLNVTSSALKRRAAWSVNSLTQLIECRTLVELSGQLEHILCGKGARSVAQGVVDVWVAFLGLALVLSLAFFAFSLGVRIAWAALVWPPAFHEKNSESSSDGGSKLDDASSAEGRRLSGESIVEGEPGLSLAADPLHIRPIL